MPIRLGLGLSPVLFDRQKPWTPGELSDLRAWYDAEAGQPKNVGYVQLDGTSGDYIYTPDSAALDALDGDIEVVMRVWCANWATGSAQTLLGRYVSSTNNRCFRFYASGAGVIGLSGSPDGASGTVVTPLVTPTNPLPTSAWFWMRLRLQLSNGSNSVGTVETAADTGSNNLVPVSFTANGSDARAVISGIFTGTAPLEIGTFNNGTLERFSGRIGRAIIRDGFDGTTVADFNADDCYGNGYTGSLGNVWTLGLPKIYDRSGNNVAPATFGSGSNQPLYLPWTGRANVYLPGVSGNYLSTPDKPSLRVAAVDARARLSLTDWTPGANVRVVSKYVASNGLRSWSFGVGAAGVPITTLSADGLTAHRDGSIGSTPFSFADGMTGWVRYTFDPASGVVSAYQAPDSDAEPTSWTLVGSSSTTGAPLHAGTANLEIGSYANGTQVVTGSILRVIVRDSIDGATVADFNAESCGQSGYTGSLGNVWTVNYGTSGRKTIVQSPAANTARSIISGGADDRLTVPAAALPTFGTSGVGAVMAVQRKRATLGTNDRVFDSKASTSATAAGFYVGSGGIAADLVANAGDGANQANSTAATGIVSGERQVVGMTVSATQVQAFVNNTFATAASRPTNSMDSGGDLTVLANSTGAEYSDATLEAIIVRGVEHDASSQAQVVAYYRGGL